MKLQSAFKKLTYLFIITSAFLPFVSRAQILPDHSYFKIDENTVTQSYEIPSIVTNIFADFIYDEVINTNQTIDIAIDKSALASRFNDPDLYVQTAIRADFDFTIDVETGEAFRPGTRSTEVTESSEYVFDQNVFSFSFNDRGTYQIELSMIKTNGILIASESYFVNVGAIETTPEIRINNILQDQEILDLQGNEKLTFTTNLSENEYDFVWGNSDEIFSTSNTFTIDLSSYGSKPNYVTLRAVNKNTNVFAENSIRFDYSNSEVYVVRPEVEPDFRPYNVEPPEVVEEPSEAWATLFSLAALAVFILIITYVMFRIIKSAKINN